MDKKVLKQIVAKKHLFMPLLFTEKQITIIQKRIDDRPLSNPEAKQWYASIRPKLNAIISLHKKDLYISTAVPEDRLEKVRQLLDVPEDAFVSGSFLFSKAYNDIDVFVISRHKGEKIVGNVHYNYIPRRALRDPIIQSAARSSAANFQIPRDHDMPKMSMFDYINQFQEAALLVMQEKDTAKDVRDLIFHHLCTDDIPDARAVHETVAAFCALGKGSKLKLLNRMIKDLLRRYKRTYLKKELAPYNRQIAKDIASFRLNEHLKYYMNAFDEVLA